MVDRPVSSVFPGEAFADEARSVCSARFLIDDRVKRKLDRADQPFGPKVEIDLALERVS